MVLRTQAEMRAEQALRDQIFPLAHAVRDRALHCVHAFQCGEAAEAARLLGGCHGDAAAMLGQIAATPRPWYSL
jgi:hypothetical protein